MNVYLFSFTKKENSTKRPDSAGVLLQCQVKTQSSIFRPTLELNFGLQDAPDQYNYAYIPDFGRYYFVEEWTYTPPKWTLNLKCDVLASFSAYIGIADLYVLRASNENDGTVIDTLYPTKAGCTFNSSSITNPWTDSQNGMYVLGVVSKQSIFGSINYFAVTRAQLQNIMQSLIDDTITTNNGFNTDDASLALQLAIIDPMQYIKSCVYIPLSDVGGTLSPGLTIFNYPILGSCKIITEPLITFTNTFAIQKHPQAGTRGIFTNLAPFTQIRLNYPPFGVIELDTTAMATALTITTEVKIDVTSGLGILRVFAAGSLISKVESQVGVSIQIAQVARNNPLSVLTGVAGGLLAGSQNTGSFLGDLIGGTAANVGDAMQMSGAKLSTIGGGGTYAHLGETPTLYFQFFNIVDDDNSHNGRPLCKVRKPIDLGGYMLIQDGDVAIPGTSEESREVRTYLEGGFYYE